MKGRIVRGSRLLLLLVILGLLLAVVPQAVVAQNEAIASASSAGFGAAFGYAASIGPIAYSSVGSIGTGTGAAFALAPGGITAFSDVWSSGAAAAFAGSLASPFGAEAKVLTSAMWGSSAAGLAFGGN